MGEPTGNPAMTRPPEITSIMAISSATRNGGLYSARELPIRQIAASVLRRARAEAIRFGEGISP
jgi:hypothetical protein